MNIFSFFLEIDKLLHISVSLILFLLIIFLRKKILKNKGFFRIIAFSIRDVLIIGILKEVFDSFGFGNPEFGDILADSFGIIIPIYLYYLIKESEKIESTNFFKYEKRLINTLKKKLIFTGKKIISVIIIKYNRLFFKKKILLNIRDKQETYELIHSFQDLFKIGKYFILLSGIWLFNLIILLIEIPFLALYDSLKLFFNSIKYVGIKIKN